MWQIIIFILEILMFTRFKLDGNGLGKTALIFIHKQWK